MGSLNSPGMSEAGQHLFADRLKQGSTRLQIQLTDPQIALMVSHANALVLWNKKINLTAIVEPLAMAEKHFIDAMAVQSFLKQEKRVIDMGSGGGFPGIPLKIMNPKIYFLLVDSSRKKINFLKQVIRTLGLTGIEAIHSRVEDLALDSCLAKTFDGVISRGFTALEPFVNKALPMLTPGGTIYALKGKQAPAEITPALRDQFQIKVDHYTLPFEKSDRYMIQVTAR